MIMHKSTIRVGTTEGRFRMIMLSVMRQFKEMYSNYDIRGMIGNAEQLREMLEKGELDIAFSGISPLAPECIEKEFLFDERLYLVVSEQMLKNYFPDRYPECVEEFKRGADIRRFSQMPFCRSLPNLHCMQILDHLLEKEGVTLNCVHTSGHFDLHQQMAQENLAACFSLTMYLPHLHELNRYNDNKLQVFPIKDLTETNPVYILTNKDKTYVEGTKEFKDLLKNVVKSMEYAE